MGEYQKKAQKEELEFWDRELTLKGDFADVLNKRIVPELRKEEYPLSIFEAILPRLEERFPGARPFKCIELGSGPLSNLAYGVDTGVIDVTAVDILASEYSLLYKKHNLANYPVKPVFGDGESLLALFPRETFHCAYVRNALDHTRDIVRSFNNLVSITKKNGFIILQHTLREGSRQNWSDAHGWDLELNSNGLVGINRKGQEFCLQKDAGVDFFLINYSAVELNRWMDVVFKKR